MMLKQIVFSPNNFVGAVFFIGAKITPQKKSVLNFGFFVTNKPFIF